ncbi:nose resistant to fluoxetine protein 6-like [Uloborus diversus]|uniref:nose resistant to fluoxetine protein 6-like n=1 Tax=Uloborus diversus TaxID=327109 RepID=UPI0024092A19|nr:nose resistant to fluoxetine protein 6-like [Uloborus diversus]
MSSPIIFVTFCAVASIHGSFQSSQIEGEEYLEAIVEDENIDLGNIEKNMEEFVHNLLKGIIPHLLEAGEDVRASPMCMFDLSSMFIGLRHLESWLFRMLDSNGKIPVGLLEGTSSSLGDYDECLDVVIGGNPAEKYAPVAQYCLLEIKPPLAIIKAIHTLQNMNMNSNHSFSATKSVLGFLRKVKVNPEDLVFRLGVCVPSSCDELDVLELFLRNFVKIGPRADIADLRLGVCIPSTCQLSDLQAIVDEISQMVMIKATTVRCEIKEGRGFTIEQIIVLTIIGIVALLVTAGTLTEVIIRNRNPEFVGDLILLKKGKLLRCFLAFSAINNARKLFTLKKDDTPVITSLRGMKFMSVCLYVVVWTYATPQDFHFLKYRSAFYFYKFMEQWWFTIFANASAGIDTLFLIAGLQVTHGLWKKSNGGAVRISIPKFILKWYFRFALSQLIVIGLFLCLPLIGNGPIWEDVVTPVIKNCQKRWWLNVLAINNFWSSSETCLPHTWLLCSLMHMLLGAPIVLFILSKWTSVGIFVNIIIILGSSVAIAMVTLMGDLPPAPAFYFLSFINIKTIWDKLFIQAYDHVAPFCIGILLGFILNRYSKIQLRKTTVIVGWCSGIASNLAVICGLYGYRHGEAMEITLSAIYASVHRIGWSLGIAWIIFACAYGYGGFVNQILSWKYFIPLEKISNLTYLLHPLIVFLHEGQLRERMYMAHLDQAMYATAYIVFTGRHLITHLHHLHFSIFLL